MYGYVYLTIDNLKGQFYVGQHKSDVYDSKYLGSGVRICNIIKKRGGTETLRNYILQECDSKETLNLAEQYWIQCYREQYGDLVLNISNGGESVMTGRHHSENTKNKISKSLIGFTHSEETKQKLSQTRKGIPHPWKQKPLSEETRKKLSNSKWINKDGKTKQVSQINLSNYLSSGWSLGRGKLK